MSDDVTFGALAVPSRRGLLQALRTTGTATDAQALAAATGLHPNTVRFHLGVLMRAGFVEERSEKHAGRGRPRTVYKATLPGVQHTGYELLANMLVTHLDQVDGGAAAQNAGLRWAQTLRPQTLTRPDDMATVARTVSALFTEMGFDPTVTTAGDSSRMMLHSCPFWSLAEKHPGVVCALHLGLLQGLVETGSKGMIEAELTPFVQPRLCQADLLASGDRAQ